MVNRCLTSDPNQRLAHAARMGQSFSLGEPFVFGLRIGLLAAVLIVIGCGQSGPRMVKVSGTVKFDGKPIANGDISFVPLSGGAPTILKITSGLYEGEVPSGKKRIEFYSYTAGKAPAQNTPGADGPIVVNTLPSKYNSESTEARDVSPPGPYTFDFDLAK
jgi:hypothetical protein